MLSSHIFFYVCTLWSGSKPFTTFYMYQGLYLGLFTDAAVNVNSVPPWSGVNANSRANPEEPNMFSPYIFWQTHSTYMRRKFVEYLGTDCLLFCRIPVELSVVSSLNTKRRPTKPSSNAMHFIKLVCWWFIGSWWPCRSLGRFTTPIQSIIFICNQ
jgi:hypothetical protein